MDRRVCFKVSDIRYLDNSTSEVYRGREVKRLKALTIEQIILLSRFQSPGITLAPQWGFSQDLSVFKVYRLRQCMEASLLQQSRPFGSNRLISTGVALTIIA